MKVRWKAHEIIFVTILVAAQIILSLLKMYDLTDAQREAFAVRFSQNGLSFIYWKKVLLPQICSVLLVYLTYLSINLVIVPLIKKISFNDFEKIFSVNTVSVVAAIAVTVYLLAIGVNIISYYGRPHLFNYADYQFLAMCGYNDAPLTDLFFGIGRAFGSVALFTVFAGIREFIIWLIERPGASREYRVMIANNTTPLIFIYFIALLIIKPIHRDFLTYVAWTTPALFLYLYTTFWLFPFNEEKPLLRKSFLWRLLLSTFIGAIFFIVVIAPEKPVLAFFFYWLFLLFIITPFCRVLYQQRKDKILQLKGLENKLAKSGADLQFLRSQINPHFLFNALNTLYGTALKEGSDQTAEGIQKLGDMMRFMLHENNLDFIPMDKEIDYLKNYIVLQKLRTQSSPGIIITDNIEESDCSQTIAPMLLIPFVENAFKHGISLQEKSWINIELYCSVEKISFEVRNSIHRFSGNDPEKNNTGIGLENVTERLKLLYPNRHEISIRNDNNEFIVHLVIKTNNTSHAKSDSNRR